MITHNNSQTSAYCTTASRDMSVTDELVTV